MRKLSLAIEDIRVDSYQVDDAPYGAGTVAAFQTEPASVPDPCTGASCTYPVRFCGTCRCAAEDGPEAPRKNR